MLRYAVSDVHGCIKELREVMMHVDLSGDNQIVFCGDYIDYGKDSGQVLSYLYELQQRHGDEKVIVLRGNHEQIFIDWLREYSFKNTMTTSYGWFPEHNWLVTDSDAGLNVFRSLVSEDDCKKFGSFAISASLDSINKMAAKMIGDVNPWLFRWLLKMPLYYETDDQIYVHAGVDEEAAQHWKVGSSDEMFLWKYPPSTGSFCKTIIAGHVGTSDKHLSNDPDHHGIYYDGYSHYYIDGSTARTGSLPVLVYDSKAAEYRDAISFA